MANIVTRTAKGSALSYTEVDQNFLGLNSDSIQNLGSAQLLILESAQIGITSSTLGKFDTLEVATFSPANVNATNVTATNSGTFGLLSATNVFLDSSQVSGFSTINELKVTTKAAIDSVQVVYRLDSPISALTSADIKVLEGELLIDGTEKAGFLGTPINSKSADYTAVLGDSGGTILHPSTDANTRTFTIPANASVAFPIGSCLTFVNYTSQNVTIAITSDTMNLSPAGTTGSRTLAQYGRATAQKTEATKWLISGTGLT